MGSSRSNMSGLSNMARDKASFMRQPPSDNGGDEIEKDDEDDIGDDGYKDLRRRVHRCVV